MADTQSMPTQEEILTMRIEDAVFAMIAEASLPQWKTVQELAYDDAKPLDGRTKQLRVDYETYFQMKYRPIYDNFGTVWYQTVKGAFRDPTQLALLKDVFERLNHVKAGKLSKEKADELFQNKQIEKYITPVLRNLGHKEL